MIDLEAARRLMMESGIGGWLAHDYRGNNPVFWELLGGKRPTTRRNFLYVPVEGQIGMIVNLLDKDTFNSTKLHKDFYSGRQELNSLLKEILRPGARIAMEYSPSGELPMISWVDGGTLDLIRGFGVDIVSSADLFAAAAAVWTKKQVRSHLAAAGAVSEIKDLAFDFIGQRVFGDGSVTEYKVREFIIEEFARRGLRHFDGPTVAADSNSGNPHYEPTAKRFSPIVEGSVVLIDLWARKEDEDDIFGDITWVGYVGENPPAKLIETFRTAAAARDLTVKRLQSAWAGKESMRGYQLDDIARGKIEAAGYGRNFPHRTGHSLGGGSHPHGLGANLDNFETRDVRRILPGTGFTIEPGIYLPDFGVRTEINVYIDPSAGPTITTPDQHEIINILKQSKKK